MKYFILLLAVFSFIGCRSHSNRTVDQFAFLELGMPIDVVTNRVGQPDRGYRGQYRLRYDLADGSEMVVTLHHKEGYSSDLSSPDFWRVYWFGQWRGTNWVWLKEPSDKK
jgi:hypothetical protein